MNLYNKVGCLHRLEKVRPDILDGIIDFLKKQRMISEDIENKYKESNNKAEYLYSILESIEKDLDMLNFNWSVLPKEYIIIDIVAKKDYKRFEHE
jgi:hypothetical protein